MTSSTSEGRLCRLRAAAAALALVLVPSVAGAAGLAVTVYSHDLGLVRETRDYDLGGARDTVRLVDVSDQLDFSSLRWAPASGRVTRLAYRFDVETGDHLLEGARGRRVRVIAKGDRAIEGTLLAADGEWLVVRGDDGGIDALARGEVQDVRLAHPPALLSMRPTVEAVVEGGRSGRSHAELSYLTRGLSWSAEHVLVRNGETGGTWSASVTVENHTGRDFADARLRLVAGEPTLTPVLTPRPMLAGAMEKAAGVAGPDLSEQTFSEYHLYSLDRPATLRDREMQSLTMIEPRPVRLTPRYRYRGGDARGVLAQLEIVNDAASGPGVPLPGGRVRIYDADESGALQLAGEPTLRHTAVGETFTLDLGTAFDLAAERRVTNSRQISDRERETSIEVKLRNRKKSGVTVVVEEPVGGDFDVVQKSHDFRKKDAGTIEFDVPVPAGKESVLTYTVRVRY